MRIVHVTDCYLPRLGGIERQVHDLAVRQQRRGHEVCVVTSTTDLAGSCRDTVGHARPARRRGRPPGEMRYRWSLQGRRLVLAGDFDVVHVHASAFSPLGFLTAASTAAAGIPTVATVHSLWSYAEPLFRAADVVTGWGRWPLAWSAVSLTAAAPLQRILGPSVPVTILPNGVDVTAWRVPRRLAVDPGRVVIATVGRLALRKRPQPFLRMMRRVRAALPAGTELEVVMMGEGPLRPSLDRFLVQHGMGGWVQLTGPADPGQIRDLYERADFYVAPATLESFGIAALEARCAGLPVVAYAASGVADFIRHDVEGLLVGDDDEMVAGILRLATSPRTVERMRRHNTDHPPTITWPIVLDRCEALYQQAGDLASGSHQPTGTRP